MSDMYKVEHSSNIALLRQKVRNGINNMSDDGSDTSSVLEAADSDVPRSGRPPLRTSPAPDDVVDDAAEFPVVVEREADHLVESSPGGPATFVDHARTGGVLEPPEGLQPIPASPRSRSHAVTPRVCARPFLRPQSVLMTPCSPLNPQWPVQARQQTV